MSDTRTRRRHRRRHDGQRHRAGLRGRGPAHGDDRRLRRGAEKGRRHDRRQPRSPGQEGQALRGRSRCGACARHVDHRLCRVARSRPDHRGRDRERSAEIRHPAQDRRDREARCAARDEHIVDLDHAAWRCHVASRPVRRHAFLQPGADDGAGRSHPRAADVGCDRRASVRDSRSDWARRRSS